MAKSNVTININNNNVIGGQAIRMGKSINNLRQFHSQCGALLISQMDVDVYAAANGIAIEHDQRGSKLMEVPFSDCGIIVLPNGVSAIIPKHIRTAVGDVHVVDVLKHNRHNHILGRPNSGRPRMKINAMIGDRAIDLGRYLKIAEELGKHYHGPLQDFWKFVNEHVFEMNNIVKNMQVHHKQETYNHANSELVHCKKHNGRTSHRDTRCVRNFPGFVDRIKKCDAGGWKESVSGRVFK